MAASTQSNASSEDEGMFSKFIAKAFDEKTRREYGKQTTPAVTAQQASSPGSKKRTRKEAEHHRHDSDGEQPDKENRQPVTKRRPSTTAEPASSPLVDTRKSSITITARNKVEYVKTWINESSSVTEDLTANTADLPADDRSELSSQESEKQKPRTSKKTKAAPKRPKAAASPAKKRVTKASKKTKNADFPTVSMPSNYFFDGSDKASRPEFNIFEDPEASPPKEKAPAKKPLKSILKSKPNLLEPASPKLKDDLYDDERSNSQESSVSSLISLKELEPGLNKTIVKAGRVMRDRTNLSFKIEPASQAAERMAKEAKKRSRSPPKKKRAVAAASSSSKTNHRRAKRTIRTQEDEELDKEMAELAKEHEGIKNYKLIVETDKNNNHHH